MDENVIAELNTLKGMLHNWKTGFLSWASPDGDNDYVLMEFGEEIRMHLYPYVKRLFETKYITELEAKEFMMYCFGQIEDLGNQLREVATRES